MPELLQELGALTRSLLGRMRIDLLGDDDDCESGEGETAGPTKKWLAHPKTLRLTTRPRMPLQPDGTRVRSFKRISHSSPLPTFVFHLTDSIDQLADRLVRDHILPMFRKLHPEKSGWNLSLVNLAVTNMAETAGNSKTANGRDIGGMFRRQDEVLKDFRVTDTIDLEESNKTDVGTKEVPEAEDEDQDNGWDDEETEGLVCCGECGMRLPGFATAAHARFHSTELDSYTETSGHT